MKRAHIYRPGSSITPPGRSSACVTFMGLIKQAKVQRSDSQDTDGRLIIDFNIVDPEIMADLTRLAKSEEMVSVAIAGKK